MVRGGNIVSVEANIHASKIEASLHPDAVYVDEGAICSDHHDGVIEDVQVSGDEVDISTARSEPYAVIYTCTNSFGGVQTAGREVYVRDTTCPSCTVNGDSLQTVEASFPYVDPGATCTDNYSRITQKAVSSVNVERQGTYHITYKALDHSGNSDTDCGGEPVVRTVQVVDTLKPVIGLRYNDMLLTKSTFMVEDEAHDRSSSAIWGMALAGCAMAIGLAMYAFGGSKQAEYQQHSMQNANAAPSQSRHHTKEAISNLV